MFENIVDLILGANFLPVGIVFTTVFIILAFKYYRYQKVVNELTSYEKVKEKLESGEKVLVFIIDTFKCTSCMKVFFNIKSMLEKSGMEFLAIDSRTEQTFVKHYEVPALIVFQKGEQKKFFKPELNKSKTDLTQYQDFITEVEKVW
ncbi:hypothetical protein [Bacillus thuringiensis]|uniref:hypothetical protein n=1 Tax=Bacillus thuringiensis TaxID=1428 RepID=UPI000CD8073D|nr:hypothetical protein [Bacillus thuringiensis]MCU4930816.1 hypothetical protein [Bacillus cereus]QFQ28798.1 hypothetical protein DDE73_29775 [Bacillus thuringiensis]